MTEATLTSLTSQAALFFMYMFQENMNDINTHIKCGCVSQIIWSNLQVDKYEYKNPSTKFMQTGWKVHCSVAINVIREVMKHHQSIYFSLCSIQPPRSAHPHVRFSCLDAEPMVIDKVPFDKYELEPSPLTQYILERKSPHTCWQVRHNIKKDFIMLLSFTPSGSMIIDFCHTDGY